MALFETRMVSKCYRRGSGGEVRAVNEVSMRIEAGRLCVLSGPSGSGKTTLLGLLGALDRPTHGQILFDGTDLGTLSDVGLARVRRRMGFVFQNFSLIPRLSIWENVTYPLIPRGTARTERYERARTLLDRLELADQIFKSPEELSGGEQQRVAVARALVGDPAVLLADEPTSNLDPRSAQSLVAIFSEIHRQGTTLVIASHDRLILELATDLYPLEQGRLRGVTA